MKYGSVIAGLLLSGAIAAPVLADPDQAEVQRIKRERAVAHWNAERRAQATPRDLLIDERGLGYLRKRSGALEPYGHDVQAGPFGQVAQGRPSGGDDTTPPAITMLEPTEGAVVGDSVPFRALITDASGVKSAVLDIRSPSGSTQSFNAQYLGEDIWGISLRGFSNGDWSWQITAKDSGAKGGNTAVSGWVSFRVDTSNSGSGSGTGTGDPGSDTVTNGAWDTGDVKQAAGRIYFEMPSQKNRRRWSGYVCSGTVIQDGTTGRSIILTAAHCVYDDANKSFARNVLFIPDQDGTTGSRTDSNCGNDPVGCWTPDFGVVDVNWTTRTFPDNIPWDYAYYVVSDTGAYQSGLINTYEQLDLSVPALQVWFGSVDVNDGTAGAGTPDFTHALGYSYDHDPDFRYCAEDLDTNGAANWWLASCELSGGSSGGPWIQPLDTSTGRGPVMSVNSWGYTTSAGMAGPKLVGTSASCVFARAQSGALFADGTRDGDAGYAASCP